MLSKVYFQPGADIGAAIAPDLLDYCSLILHHRAGHPQPPSVIQFNASNVPVAQLTASSDSMSEEKVFDYGLEDFIPRPAVHDPGPGTPAPFGGKQRQINVDIDPRALASKGLSPASTWSTRCRRPT